MVFMDRKNLRDVVDLESGTNAVLHELEGPSGTGLGQAKKLFTRVWSGFLSSDGSIKGEEAATSECPVQNGEALSDFSGGEEEKRGLLEKKAGPERPKRKGCKKPPRPPRPPRAPSLDAAELKLVREISELAMLKRARMERMKALKKMKNTKTKSSNSNLCALVVTILFCLVILWQGVFSRGCSSMTFHGSPESSLGPTSRLISVQFYKNVSTDNGGGSSSASPNNDVERITGLDEDRKESSKNAE